MTEFPPLPLRLGGEPLPTVGRVRVYVCGITPYAVTHLGHASTFLWSDLAARVLRATGSAVELTRNVTDVDESLLAEARRRDEPYDQLASRQRFAFDRTMETLRVRLPDREPTARQAVAQVIQLVQALLLRGAAYEREGTVYARAAAAAARAGVDPDEALRLAAEYGDQPDDPAKEHPLDVVVWRGATDEGAGASWPSRWGPGRPGWHAQCTAMVLSSYGSGVDLHAGGADLRFPHHAVEALLGEAATGVAPFARAWMRPGIVSYAGAKMAKSTGNLVLVEDLLETVSPAVIRLLCLDRPWREAWEYEPAALQSAAGRLEALYAAASHPGGSRSAAQEVDRALLDDLDVERAIDLALEEGGGAARRVIDVCQLH
ncbi:cysteine--tRNA ligase [Motilibacter sp. K478]|nr:cysteine--tRNA ligase [Motilibacter aurantiacus]NHC47660.1 cysteine--tRNA ligase [Motilibacter aurantiacus]